MTYEPVTLDHLLEHQSWAMRIARQLVREEHEAEEIVQRTWIAALRRPPSSARGARAWIRRVLQNLARERHRRAGTRLRHELASQDERTTAPDASEAVSREEIRELLADRLLALQEPYRTTLTLRYYEDLSSTEIAERLGVPSGTVRWRLKVGLDQLREELDRRCHGDRQRWVSALVLLAPGAALPGEEVAAPAIEGAAGSAPTWLPVLGGVGLAAGLAGFAWFAWFQPEPNGSADGSRAVDLAANAATAGDGERLSGATDLGTRAPLTPPPTRADAGSAGHAGLTVQVVDAAGAAVAGAAVSVVSRGQVDERATTDANGMALVPFEAADLGALGLPATRGRLSLFARAPGHVASAYWHVVSPLERREPFVLSLGAGHETPLRGRVVDGAGLPIANALLAWCNQRGRVERPSELDFPGPSVVTTRSESDGGFLLTGITRGSENLFIFREGFALTAVSPGHEEWVEVVLHPGATLTGRLLEAGGTPAVGVRVATEPLQKSNEWTASLPAYDPIRRGFPEATRTDAAGFYRLTCIAPGERTVWAGGEADEGIASTTLRLEEGLSQEWSATLGAGRALALRLVDEQDAPLADWLVVLRRPGGTGTWWLRRVTSGADGRLRLLDCPEGDLYLDVLDASGLGSTYLSRKVVAGGPEEVLRIETRGLAQVRGTLVDHLGGPELGGKLTLFALRTALTHELERDLAGRFDQRLGAGSYALVLALDRGARRVARFELAADQELDLGLLALPAPGTLRLEARELANGIARTPSYSLFALFDDDGKETFLKAGTGEIEGEALLSLLPGRYRVLLFDGSGNLPEKHEVTVEPFAETRLAR